MAKSFKATISAGVMASAIALPLVISVPAVAQTEGFSQLPIGFVSLTADPRFDNVLADYQVPVRPWGSAVPGAVMGIEDAGPVGKAIKVDFTLRDTSAASVGEIEGVVRTWSSEGVNFVITDLGTSDLLSLSDAVKDLPVTLLNISAQSDTLRGEMCRSNVVHIIPSFRMGTDAIVQYLVSKNWKNILVLAGPLPEDQEIVKALNESVAMFGARIVETRPFELTADPRRREQNNVALLTQGNNFDVVFVADSHGEFARTVPYQTNPPRPVVGSAGLTAQAWHWSFERNGAPQVNSRFKQATGRMMHSNDWAAWAAVRAVSQSTLRSRSTDYDKVRDYLLGTRMNLDGSKGNPMSVRQWDHQLRQGMMVSAGNVVVQLAPVEGFLHAVNDLDTLGVDVGRTACKF